MFIKRWRNISPIRTGCHQSTGNLSFTMSYNYVYDVPYWCALHHWNSRTVLCLIVYSLPPDVYCRKRSWNEVECSSYQQVQLNAHSSTERTLNTELTREIDSTAHCHSTPQSELERLEKTSHSSILAWGLMINWFITF